MAYRAPYVDTTGLHIPSYEDIRDDLIEGFKSIFGEDVYLEPDSQDYEMISLFALKQYDTMQLLEIVYNNRTPKTAVGTALDSLVKLNGINRKKASHSTVELLLTGVVGTEIINGRVKDEVGNTWLLPESVVIDESPKQVTGTAEEIGDVKALAHSITKIETPTAGWTAVDNAVAAVPGKPVESDTLLRRRQSISVATPSLSMVDSLIAGIAAVTNIERFIVYDNDTNVTDANTVPAHSVCVVAEGGNDVEIAKVIYRRKGPGTGTYGDVMTKFYDNNGQPIIIRFFRPSYRPVNVKLKFKRLAGYTKEIQSQMYDAIRDYLNTLAIGQEVYASQLWGTALSAIIDVKNPSFIITELTVNGLQTVNIGFNEISQFGSLDIEEVL